MRASTAPRPTSLTPWRSSIPRLALLITLTAPVLAPAAEAANRSPSVNRKHVCDWAFVSGPRQGQSGTESRRWLGSLPTLQGSTWWAGNTADHTNTFTAPTNIPGATETTRWNATVKAGTATLTGKVDVAAALYLYAQTQRVVYHSFSNGAYVSCLELSPSVLDRLQNTYAGSGADANVCNCGTGFHYDATVACVERCTAYWNNNERWARLAPQCLRGDSIVGKLACLLSRDPSVGGAQAPWDPGHPTTCSDFPSTFGCNGEGGSDGSPCGTSANPNQAICRPGCVCQANNTCRCYPPLPPPPPPSSPPPPPPPPGTR